MKSIDIETVPNLNLVSALPDPEVKYGNTKDEAKRKIIEDEAKQKQIDDMALSPYWGRICSVAWCDRELKGDYAVIDNVSDYEEIEIIKLCLSMCVPTHFNEPTIITFNGVRFDMPFIYKRAMLLSVELPTGSLPLRAFTKRYELIPHCDIAMEAVEWDLHKYQSLNFTSSGILGEKKIDVDVTKFHEMIENGQQKEIGIYNLQDAELTMKLYNKMENYIF